MIRVIKKIRNIIKTNYWKIFKPRTDDEIIIKRYKIRFKLNLTNDVDYRFYLNVFEKKEIRYFKQILQPEMTILDIGANIGIYTLIAAKQTENIGKVIAFEPAPKAYNSLKINVELNQFNNVIINNLAVSDKEGEAKLFLCEDDAYNSLTTDTFKRIIDSISISTISIDKYIVLNNIERVDFIKIDTEGFELQVLNGARKTLEMHSPILMFEHNNKAKEKNDIKVFSMLKNLNYKLFYLSNKYKLKLLDIYNIKTSTIIAKKDKSETK